MSRAFKFRVWHIKNKCFLEDMNEWGMVFFHPDTKYFQPLNQFLGSDFVIQQFTGLQDKNGKDIYEGDILTFFKNDGKYIVKFGIFHEDAGDDLFDGNGFFLERMNGKNQYSLRDAYKNCNIIKNIFENP